MAWKHKEFSGVSSTMFLNSQDDNFLIKPLQSSQREEIACVINCVNKNLNEIDWYGGENSMRVCGLIMIKVLNVLWWRKLEATQ